jgi:L-ascorbate metabolism protein UlaG (beta-lactamase superfamily)
MPRTNIFNAFLPLLIIYGTTPGLAAENDATTVQVTVLFSEGILMRSGDATVLIDAFIDARKARGDPDAMKARQDLIAGHPPFTKIQLALVSHLHREHFHAVTAGAFLENHPETILASSSEILHELKDKYPGYLEIKHQLVEIGTVEGQMTSYDLAGIQVDFIPLNHEASIYFPEPVLGHIVHIGDLKILYTSDAEMRADNWQRYDLKSQNIDIAIMPFWLFKEEITRDIFDKFVAPKVVSVVQISPQQREKEFSNLAREFPDVVFLSTAVATAEF